MESLELNASLFQPPQQCHRENACLIVGGGVAGLLAALKLSSSNYPGPISILDKRPTLGGRFMSPPAWEISELPDLERWKTYNRARQKQSEIPATGFECLPPHQQQMMIRHIQSCLDDSEALLWDEWFSSTADREDPIKKTYFLKKKLNDLRDVISEYSSEVITRKESSFILHIEKNSADRIDKLKETSEWKELRKNQRNAVLSVLYPLFETEVEEMLLCEVSSHLSSLRKSISQPIPREALRCSGIELFLEIILRRRGVSLLLEHNLLTLEKKKDSFYAEVNNLKNGTRVLSSYSQVIVTTSPHQALAFLGRSSLTPDHSKILAKVQPQSAVLLEVPHYHAFLLPELKEKLLPGTEICFPVERLKGYALSQGTFVFRALIPYEVTANAPAVKHCLASMRRAASRLFQEESLVGFAPGARIPHTDALQVRLVLESVYTSLPQKQAQGLKIESIVSRQKGLAFCGDVFTFSKSPFENILESVSAAVNETLR